MPRDERRRPQSVNCVCALEDRHGEGHRAVGDRRFRDHEPAIPHRLRLQPPSALGPRPQRLRRLGARDRARSRCSATARRGDRSSTCATWRGRSNGPRSGPPPAARFSRSTSAATSATTRSRISPRRWQIHSRHDVSINKDAPPDRRSYQVDFSLYQELAPEHLPAHTLEDSIARSRKGSSHRLSRRALPRVGSDPAEGALPSQGAQRRGRVAVLGQAEEVQESPCMQARDIGRWFRHAAVRGDRGSPEADGRDRRAPDPVAHHEDLFGLRNQ